MTKLSTLTLLVIIAFPHLLYGITTIHHDKPEESSISEMATKMIETNGERQKRLLPYVNYYLSRKPQRQKFTPFLESNALPGPFIPIVKATPKPIEDTPESVIETSPNYAYIYDTLIELKQAQQTMRHNYDTIYGKPVYVPIQYYEDPYRNAPPSKTIIETYTPTDIDIDTESRKKYDPVSNLELYRYKPQAVDSYVTDTPIQAYRTQTEKPFFGEKIVAKPTIRYEQKNTEYTQHEKPVTYVVESKPQTNTIIDEKYVAGKIIPPPEQFVTEKPTYIEYYSSPLPAIPTENTNILAKILKQLQKSNMLPQTLTPQNIDNSIRTLVKILNGLKKQQGLTSKPIVVAEEDEVTEISEEEDSEEKPFEDKPIYTPGSHTQSFPANTIDGGTPGRPGIDYPALSSIPHTDFNCKKQRYKGFFGDPHTNCQVWHYCDLNGGQASFLCPNGTIFSQVALTCDWWYNVKCSSTAQLYVLNERLYKYILPFVPKFPEDYSGPLVDRYLALKFQEMEEKMKKERKKGDKKEEKSEEDKDDSDQLQDIQNEKNRSEEN